jgi:hypothetical protein
VRTRKAVTALDNYIEIFYYLIRVGDKEFRRFSFAGTGGRELAGRIILPEGAGLHSSPVAPGITLLRVPKSKHLPNDFHALDPVEAVAAAFAGRHGLSWEREQ